MNMSKFLSSKKEFVSYGAVLLLGLFMSALAASAATTISTNIVTGGSVGVASSTPGAPLSVVGNGYFDGGTVYAKALYATSSITSAGTLSVTGVSTLTGNVGIASTSAGFPLSVVGSSYFDGGTVYAKAFLATSSITSAGTLTITGASGFTGLATFVSASTTSVGSTGSAYLSTAGTGTVGIGTTTLASGPVVTFGTNPSTSAASTTIYMGKLQWQGQTSTGATVCIYITGAGATASTTIQGGACNN